MLYDSYEDGIIKRKNPLQGSTQKIFKEQMMKKNLFIWAGALFIIIGLLLGSLDIYKQLNYEKVDAVLSIKYTGAKGTRKEASVSYDYNGVTFENKGLSSYNGFTMKNGGNYTVYIDPDKPDKPKTVSYVLEIVAVSCGIASVIIGIRNRKK